jgi:hypothetical protein
MAPRSREPLIGRLSRLSRGDQRIQQPGEAGRGDLLPHIRSIMPACPHLQHGGTIEHPQGTASHESPRPAVGARLMAYAAIAFVPSYILHQTVMIVIGCSVV